MEVADESTELWRHPQMAFLYFRYIVLGDDVERTCRYNASVALGAGFPEIARAWTMAAARLVKFYFLSKLLLHAKKSV